jgi:hypothetical protein
MKALKNYFSKTVSSRIVVMVFILSQFLSIDLFAVGGFPITLQKLLALIFFPVILYGFGFRSLALKKEIVILTSLYVVTIGLYYLVHMEMSASFFLVLLTTGFNAVTAVLLLTAMVEYDEAFAFLGKLWAAFAFITAIITFCQFLGLLPSLHNISVQIYVSHGNYYYRGTGTLTDPNYTAVLLLAGLGFVLGVPTIRMKPLLLAVIVLGILGTVSRMGFVGIVLGMLVSPFYLTSNRIRPFLYRFSFVFIIIGLITLSYLFPSGASEVILSRIDSTRAVTESIASSDEENDSIEQKEKMKALTPQGGFRYLLIKQAFRGFADNPWFGIGGYKSSRYINDTVGQPYVLHNTYLEFLLAGGIWGCFLLLYFFFITLKAAVLKNNLQRKAVLLQILVFYFTALFLSFDTDFYMWSIFVFAVWVLQSGLPEKHRQVSA